MRSDLSSGGRVDRRLHSYAPHPYESVGHPGLITTLFPHLGQRRAHDFRITLIAGLVLISILYAFGFVSAALLASAVLVPILYLLYLHDSGLSRDEPLAVIGLTLGSGAGLGVLISILVSSVAGYLVPVRLGGQGVRIDLGALLLLAVLVPVIEEAIKPIPALVLRRRSSGPRKTVDGFVFGVAAGLGYALAQTVVSYADVIRSIDIRVSSANWLYLLITAAILLPVLQGTATGVITAALWRRHLRAVQGTEPVTAIGVAAVAHVAFVLGILLLTAAGAAFPVRVIWQALIVGGLLVYARYVLHHAVLDYQAAGGQQAAADPQPVGRRT